MAYAIKVKKGFLARTTKRLRDGWISQYGFTTVENPDIARRFGKKASAEEFALMLAIKCPHYLGKLSVGVLVVGDAPGDVRWREKKVKDHTHIWKRRLRTTISANPSDKQIVLAICWSTNAEDAALPTKEVKADPILWNIWCMKTGWRYKVWVERPGVMAHIDNVDFKDEREAVEEYRRRCKEFPRSKDVDYGYPIDET